jgi:hypothetical protein
MRKLISEEVHRIQTLMGVKKPLIIENIGTFFEKMGVSSDKVIERLEKSGSKYSETIGKQFIEMAKKSILNASERNFLSGIVRKLFPEVVEKYVVSIETGVFRNNSVQMAQIDRLFKESRVPTENIRNFIKAETGVGLELEGVQLWRDYRIENSSRTTSTATVADKTNARVRTADAPKVSNAPLQQKTGGYLGTPTITKVEDGTLYEFRTEDGLIGGVMISPTQFRIDGISANVVGSGQGTKMFEELITYLKGKGVTTIATESAGEGAIKMHNKAVEKGILTKVKEDGRTATFTINAKPIANVKPYEIGDVVVTGTELGEKVIYGKDYNLPDFRGVLETESSSSTKYARGIYFREFIRGDKKVFSLIDGSIEDLGNRSGFIATSIVLDKNTTMVLKELKADLESLHARARSGLNGKNQIDMNKVKQQMSGVKWVSQEVKPVAPITKAATSNAPQILPTDVTIEGTFQGYQVVKGSEKNAIGDIRQEANQAGSDGLTEYTKQTVKGDKKIFTLVNTEHTDNFGRRGFKAASVSVPLDSKITLDDVMPNLEAAMGSSKVAPTGGGLTPKITNAPKVGETAKAVGGNFNVTNEQSLLKKLFLWFDSKFYEANGKRHSLITDAQIEQMLPETKQYILSLQNDLKRFDKNYRDGNYYSTENNSILKTENDLLKHATHNMWGGFGRYSEFNTKNMYDKIPYPSIPAPPPSVIANLNKIFPSPSNGLKVEF